MKKNCFKNLLKKKNSGMSLMEIVVAIGISVVTMTTAAVFSNSLVYRAQENFNEVAALQLQNTINEQIRLLELAMKKDIKRPGVDLETGGYLSSASWSAICSESPGDNDIFLKLNFPEFNPSTPQVVSIDRLSPAEVSFQSEEGESVGYKFYTLNSSIDRIGSFEKTNSPVEISIKKEISNQGGIDLLKNVKFTTVISYNVLGKRIFTKPQELKMVHSLICEKN